MRVLNQLHRAGGGLFASVATALKETPPGIRRAVAPGEASDAPTGAGADHLPWHCYQVALTADLRTYLEWAKIVAELSGVAGLAALLPSRAHPQCKMAIILCGGNIDALALTDITRRKILRADRYLHLLTACDDPPGSLALLLDVVGAECGNVIRVTHNRLRPNVAPVMTGAEILVEVRDRAHSERTLPALTVWGYPAERLI